MLTCKQYNLYRFIWKNVNFWREQSFLKRGMSYRVVATHNNSLMVKQEDLSVSSGDKIIEIFFWIACSFSLSTRLEKFSRLFRIDFQQNWRPNCRVGSLLSEILIANSEKVYFHNKIKIILCCLNFPEYKLWGSIVFIYDNVQICKPQNLFTKSWMSGKNRV